MFAKQQTEKAVVYLNKLCLEIDNRRTGSAGNRASTAFFAELVSSYGFDTRTPRFECLDWRQEGAELSVDGEPFPAFPSPYTSGCQVRAQLVVVSSLEELAAANLTGKILLLRGDITHEQLMPKNFPFYNPDHHQQIYRLLETQEPLAIIAATGRDVHMVGDQYPFPLFEDGDFDIPSVYMKDVEGDRLARLAGRDLSLTIRAERLPSHGCNVVARKGSTFPRRVVLFAHIDAKINTPGAGDNASGVVVLLLLAELLAASRGRLGIEIVAMNGEDYFSSPGERQFLARNADTIGEILLGFNIDGVGYQGGNTAYSLYGCPDLLSTLIADQFAQFEGIVPGEPWYAGDHGLFLMNQVPALALTSDRTTEMMASVTHTPEDTPAILEPTLLVELAEALHGLLLRMDRNLDRLI